MLDEILRSRQLRGTKSYMPDRPAILRRPRVMLDLSDVGLTEAVPLLGHYYNIRADAMLATHGHQQAMEICYLARGRQVYRVRGRDYAMRAGEVFVTFPGEQHSSGGRPQEKGELFWIQVCLPRRGRFLSNSMRDAGPLLRALRQLPRRHFAASTELAAQFHRLIISAGAKSSPTKRLDLSSQICQFLLELAACAGRKEAAQGESAQMQVVLNYIRTRLANAPGIGELAGVMGVSTSWFKARFRRHMGMPPGEYVQRARIEKAGELLLAGRRVTDVAMTLGFSSSQYFATVYKRFTGRSPGTAGG